MDAIRVCESVHAERGPHKCGLSFPVANNKYSSTLGGALHMSS